MDKVAVPLSLLVLVTLNLVPEAMTFNVSTQSRSLSADDVAAPAGPGENMDIHLSPFHQIFGPLPSGRLEVKDNYFVFKNQRIFLSGGNLPWIWYAYDFGDNRWVSVKPYMANQIQLLKQAGGNSMRLWIHIQGETSPAFDNNGYVTGYDHLGSFLSDFMDMLDLAKDHDILVFPTLWNGAIDQDIHHRLDGLMVDPNKLQSYIDIVLTPLVTAVNGHPALGAWDIINEPEGMLTPGIYNSNPCFDTTGLANSGAGWAGHKYNYQQILRFINRQASAIKTADPKALVTVGVWNPKTNMNTFGYVDHYTDSCLFQAGGQYQGKLDFYQFHTYPHNGAYDFVSPLRCNAPDYGTSKPIVVGEFWTQDGGGLNIYQQFDYIYHHGYAGAWSWHLVDHGQIQRAGINHIKTYTSNGVIPINI